MIKKTLAYSITFLIGVSLTSVKAGAPTGIGSGLGVLSRLFDYRGLKKEDEYNTKLKVIENDLKELEGLEGDTSKELRRRIRKKISRLYRLYMRSAGNQALFSALSSIGSEIFYNPENFADMEDEEANIKRGLALDSAEAASDMEDEGANTMHGLALDSAAAASEWFSYGGARKLGRNLKKRKILTLLLAATDIARFFSEKKGREWASHRKNVTVPLLFIQRILKLYRYYLARGFKNISLRDIVAYAALTGSAFGTTLSSLVSARANSIAEQRMEGARQKVRDAYKKWQRAELASPDDLVAVLLDADRFVARGELSMRFSKDLTREVDTTIRLVAQKDEALSNVIKGERAKDAIRREQDRVRRLAAPASEDGSEDDSDPEGEDCPVCLCSLAGEEVVVPASRGWGTEPVEVCHHGYHKGCLKGLIAIREYWDIDSARMCYECAMCRRKGDPSVKPLVRATTSTH